MTDRSDLTSILKKRQGLNNSSEAELELSVESRSFANRVNDQRCEKDSKEFQMSQKMEKNYQNNCQSIANTTDLTLKQMFDESTRLVSEQDEISGFETIGWENHSKKSSIFSARRSTSFRNLCGVLERSIKIRNPTMLGRKRIEWITSSQSYRDFDGIS